MKCGSCRDTDAESYKKITEGDSLLDILKTLNPRRRYNATNSYFCGLCIQLAMAKQAQTISTMSDQNANSVTNLNTSTSSSKDEFDLMVMSKKVFTDTGTPMPQPYRSEKRPAAENAQKPCPKRHKQLFKPILEKNLSVQKESSQHKTLESSQQSRGHLSQQSRGHLSQQSRGESQRSRGELSQQNSSESIPEINMLLDVDHDSSSSRSSALLETQSPGKSRSPQSLPSFNLQTPGQSPNEIRTARTQQVRETQSPTERRSLRSSPLNPQNQGQTPGKSVSARTQPFDRQSPGKGRSSHISPSPNSQSPAESRSLRRSPLSNLQNQRQTPTTSRVQPDSVSLSSKVTRNPTGVSSNVSGGRTAKNKPQSIIKPRPKTLLQYDSDSLSDDASISSNQRTTVQTNNQIRQTHQDTVQAPTAPAVRNPRIRQDNSNIPTDIRSYFSTQEFNVSNYSRTLAG